MLSKSEEKLIKSLHKKKYRQETGLCLVEGEKLVADLANFTDLVFNNEDTRVFSSLVTTDTPQGVAAIAKIPEFNAEDVLTSRRIVLLDHVQDPGNVGAFFRLALGFGFKVVLRECADPFSPKVIRSSGGAVFRVPHVQMTPEEAENFVSESELSVYKAEMSNNAIPLGKAENGDCLLIFGNEGQGILGYYAGQSVYIEHAEELESLSVSHAGAIMMHYFSNR